MGISWPHSGLIERDNNDERAIGALAYFFLGSTTTPFTVFEDADESTPHDHPVEADGNGRWPVVFIPYTTSYDVKVTTAGGTQLFYHTEISNPNPVDAAADTAADEELLRTGDCFFRIVDTTLTGCVRLNGRTIGNAASGATERANADTVDLFTHWYDNLADGQAPVSGGRGANAAADYAANKTITSPNLCGAFPLGLDDMGNTDAALSALVTYSHGNSTTPGSLGGGPAAANSQTLTEANLAAHTHADGTLAAASNGAHTHTVDIAAGQGSHTHAAKQDLGGVVGGFTTTSAPADGGAESFTTEVGANTLPAMTGSATSNGAHTHDVTGATSSTGSGTAHNIVSRHLRVTWFCKL